MTIYRMAFGTTGGASCIDSDMARQLTGISRRVTIFDASEGSCSAQSWRSEVLVTGRSSVGVSLSIIVTLLVPGPAWLTQSTTNLAINSHGA